jgi:hypothetical protein
MEKRYKIQTYEQQRGQWESSIYQQLFSSPLLRFFLLRICKWLCNIPIMFWYLWNSWSWAWEYSIHPSTWKVTMNWMRPLILCLDIFQHFKQCKLVTFEKLQHVAINYRHKFEVTPLDVFSRVNGCSICSATPY